jgi:rhodanese-related sulfurtransferase/uncharacterized membrane protein YedE/YeeE
MGPLIPYQIINGELNLLFAFFIGIGFGYILEQAGFSSARKLAGVFYGYDFTVLKVFFTAGITAALGLYFFRYLGWIDFNMVYVNPLYVRSAIVGGAVMGLGFVLGGYCPGTSLAAAMIGKIDAMVFIGGMFIGIFLFGLFYPVFEPLHTSHFAGNVFIYDTLGMSQSWFLFILVLVALSAFTITQKIENNATRFKELLHAKKLDVRMPLALLLILSVTAVLLPNQRKSLIGENNSHDLVVAVTDNHHYVSPLKVAHSLVHQMDDLYLIDVRSREQYQEYHLPGAINLPLEQLSNKYVRQILNKPEKTIVFYSNGSTFADKAWLFSQRAGYRNIRVLSGGLNGFFDVIFSDSESNQHIVPDNESTKMFISKASEYFKNGDILKRSGTNKSIPKAPDVELMAADGGC